MSRVRERERQAGYRQGDRKLSSPYSNVPICDHNSGSLPWTNQASYAEVMLLTYGLCCFITNIMITANGTAYCHLENPQGKIYAHNHPGIDPEHLLPPAATLPEQALVGSDDIAALETVADAYFGAMSDERYARLTSRVAALRNNDIVAATGELPAITVCIPIAAMGESEQTIGHTLQLIAAQAGSETAEVLLYANYNTDKHTDQAQVASKQAMLARLQAGALQSERPLRVRYLMEGYPEHELAISRVRKDAADIVALDTLERGGGYQHAVLWLDADTTHLTPGLLAAHIDQQQANGRNLALTTTQNNFSMNDPGHEYQPGDTAQKLAAYNEILRRHASHRKLIGGISSRPAYVYPQENGLSFVIGTYLLVGGFDTSKRLNESLFLLAAAERHERAARAVLGSMATALHVELPRHLRAHSSGRRHIKHTQRYLTQGQDIQFVADGAGPYAVYSGAFSGSEDAIREQNISCRREQSASTPDPELVQRHICTILNQYGLPAGLAASEVPAYIAFAFRISERLGLAELVKVAPDDSLSRAA